MLNILQARLQQYMNRDLQMLKLDFEKAEDPEIKCQHLLDHQKSMRVSEKYVLLPFDYAKGFDCVDHYKLWKILKEMGIPDHLLCLLRNLYASQEAAVRTCHGTMDLFQIGKGISQGCILSPCLFSCNAETSCEMPGWMKHKLKSSLSGEISKTSDMQMTSPLWQK